ncbi:MAG TPA: hypothetical protein VLW53_23935, partial [Candidatus Eisenbacteria bacterium]|nr:hypothetical protein [Candidatus Eisenbacteria bacterium]
RRTRLRLAWAYLRHELRRRLRPAPAAEAEEVVTAYAEDRLRPLTPGERSALPAMSRCVGCGLCALVLRRVGRVRPADLASTYLRDLTLLPAAAADLSGDEPPLHALAAAAAVCPVGVPLDQVAAAVRRLAAPSPLAVEGRRRETS